MAVHMISVFSHYQAQWKEAHDMVYVCYDNGAYMNTGIQRSSATPRYADTTTSPAGKVVNGKQQGRKELTESNGSPQPSIYCTVSTFR